MANIIVRDVVLEDFNENFGVHMKVAPEGVTISEELLRRPVLTLNYDKEKGLGVVKNLKYEEGILKGDLLFASDNASVESAKMLDAKILTPVVGINIINDGLPADWNNADADDVITTYVNEAKVISIALAPTDSVIHRNN